ncbi:MAG TPA: hypothetical protein VGM18_13795 [Candidatus Sulfotelmatobacter sp.]
MIVFSAAQPREQYQRSRGPSHQEAQALELDDRHETTFAERQAFAQTQPTRPSAPDV